MGSLARSNDRNRRVNRYAGEGIDEHILYVHPEGSDNNDGLSKSSPKQRIQSAYDALPAPDLSGGFPVDATGGGLINLMPGRHDVGTGLSLFRQKPVELRSVIGNPARRLGNLSGTRVAIGAILYSSESTQPDELVALGIGGAGTTDTTNNANGHTFRDVQFELAGVCTAAIRAENWNQGLVIGCSAQHLDEATEPDAWLCDVLNTGEVVGSDTSWNQMIGNLVNRMGLYKGVTTTTNGLNNNCHVIDRNICFGNATRTDALVEIHRGIGCAITNNNFETSPKAVELLGDSGGANGSRNYMAGNSGEGCPIWLRARDQNHLIMLDGGNRTASATDVLIDIADGGDNLVIEAAISILNAGYDRDDAWVDTAGTARISPRNREVGQQSTFEAIGNRINTVDKYQGKMVLDLTSGDYLYANGSAAGDTWRNVGTGATVYAPTS